MSRPLALASSVIDVWDHHYEVWLLMLINFMYNMSIKGVPGAQDGDWGHVGAPGAGVVSHRGPGASP